MLRMAIIRFEDEERRLIAFIGPYQSFSTAGQWLGSCGFLASEGPANEWTCEGPFKISFDFESGELSVKTIRATVLPLKSPGTMLILPD